MFSYSNKMLGYAHYLYLSNNIKFSKRINSNEKSG